VKKQVPELAPKPIPKAIPQPVPAEENLNEGEMELLKLQIAKMEQTQEVPQETEGGEPSEEDIQKFQQLQAEIERLQNDGVFRAELLFQLVDINKNLARLGGGNAQE